MNTASAIKLLYKPLHHIANNHAKHSLLVQETRLRDLEDSFENMFFPRIKRL